jgi:crossover junction endodeoxyribonuclease RusA
MARRGNGDGGGALDRAAPSTLLITLPLPPGVNNQYSTVNGRRVLSSEARRFKVEVGKRVSDLLFASGGGSGLVQDLRGSYLSLFIDFYFATPMKRDLDGGLKITQDALCEALQINDNRVVDIHLVKRIDPRRPRIEVQLETIPESEWQFDEEYIYRANSQTDGAAGDAQTGRSLR